MVHVASLCQYQSSELENVVMMRLMTTVSGCHQLLRRQMVSCYLCVSAVAYALSGLTKGITFVIKSIWSFLLSLIFSLTNYVPEFLQSPV